MNDWIKLVNKTWKENKHKPNYVLADAIAEAKKVYYSLSDKVANVKKKGPKSQKKKGPKSQKKRPKSQKKRSKSQKKR